MRECVPALAGADSKSVAGGIELRRPTLRRIDAELAGQTLALGKGKDPTLNKLAATAPLVQQQADACDKPVKDGFFSPLPMQDKRREAINLQQENVQ